MYTQEHKEAHMNVIICIDNRGGVAFNHRRQSRDQVLCQKLTKTYGKIKIAPYSEPLFAPDSVCVVDDPLNHTGKGEFCFIEKQTLSGYEDRIEALVLCKWNRDYPGDESLGIDLNGWRLLHTEEFPGKSHDKITMEVWKK